MALCATAIIAGGSPPVPSVAVRGDLPRSGTVTFPELEKLAPVEVTWKHHEKSYQFTGVPLETVVAQFGLTSGEKSETVSKSEKRSGYKFVIVASSPDGYQAVYSFAEIAATNGTPSKVFLVWKLDGKPLPEDMGPFRLVSTTDGEGARSVYHLSSLDIVDMRKIAKVEVIK